MPFVSPASKPIHPEWADHHRPTATATLTSTCVITVPSGDGGTDADGNWTPSEATALYDGPCRLQALTTNERVELAGEAQETVRRFLLALEWDADRIPVGAAVRVTDTDDPYLSRPGMPPVDLRVVDPVRTMGSQMWQRDLIVEEVTR